MTQHQIFADQSHSFPASHYRINGIEGDSVTTNLRDNAAIYDYLYTYTDYKTPLTPSSDMTSNFLEASVALDQRSDRSSQNPDLDSASVAILLDTFLSSFAVVPHSEHHQHDVSFRVEIGLRERYLLP